MAWLVRTAVFLGMVGLGLWGFLVLPAPWNWAAFIAAFLAGGIASMILFKRMASDRQRKDALEARLHND